MSLQTDFAVALFSECKNDAQYRHREPGYDPAGQLSKKLAPVTDTFLFSILSNSSEHHKALFGIGQ